MLDHRGQPGSADESEAGTGRGQGQRGRGRFMKPLTRMVTVKDHLSGLRPGKGKRGRVACVPSKILRCE